MTTMTFDDAVAETNAQGWYIYQLWQEEPVNDTQEWGCCLRALTGNHRRDIARAIGEDPISAICNALCAAPELEREVRLSKLRETTPTISIRHLFFKPKEKMRRPK